VFYKGRWATHEKAKLRANIDKFCSDNKITDLQGLIFPEGESGRRKRTTEGQKELYKAAAAGIMRPIFNVYRQVLRMYDESNKQGRFVAEDVREPPLEAFLFAFLAGLCGLLGQQVFVPLPAPSILPLPATHATILP